MAVQILDPSSIPLKRRSETTVWTTLSWLGVVLIVGVLGAILLLAFVSPMQRGDQLRAEAATQQHKLDQETERQQLLQEELELMRNDPDYLERVARDRLNLGKTNEVIFRFSPLQPEPGYLESEGK